jgi:hypothetical protein
LKGKIMIEAAVSNICSAVQEATGFTLMVDNQPGDHCCRTLCVCDPDPLHGEDMDNDRYLDCGYQIPDLLF